MSVQYNKKPLDQRRTPAEPARKAIYKAERRLTRDEINRRVNGLAAHYVAFIQQGFIGRMRWLFFGAPKPPTQPVQRQEEVPRG